MPAASTKANYKTYEAQARMVRAIVAAHPEVKWNYKDIAKYFGESTPDGIGFQFRGIKKDAETLRKVESEGGDVANCLSLGTARGSSSVMSTPSKPTAFRSTGSRSGTGTGRKRARKTDMIKRSESDEEDDDDVLDGHNWSEHEDTPTKKPRTGAGAFPGQRTGTPSRRAAARANATIAEVSALLDNSDSQPEMEASSSSAAASQPTTTTTSASFAPRDASPEPPSYDRFGTRPIIGVNTGPPAVASYHSISHYGSGSQPFSGSVYDDLGDGEI